MKYIFKKYTNTTSVTKERGILKHIITMEILLEFGLNPLPQNPNKAKIQNG